mmetsp:Transcript_14204/g.39133  ORF Transcript_14204/g.39133 Transcript_14204/m.39133 type:complete len:235 (-) Transcript_14204:170-874(-)
MNPLPFLISVLVLLALADAAAAFTPPRMIRTTTVQLFAGPSIQDASAVLREWDQLYNPETLATSTTSTSLDQLRPKLVSSVLALSQAATDERNADSTTGRCMLGICAPSAGDAVEVLKSWVTALGLPRGLLHGMDKDGVPLELDGGVYIKYNSGGVYTFADIRKSGMGFDALWKPGDALLEPYDGTYRGVYFQVELADGEFRQYMVPLDLFFEAPSRAAEQAATAPATSSAKES